MSHECDGDCLATAEWRQTQIRDLTERAVKAEKALSRQRRLLEVLAFGTDWAGANPVTMRDELRRTLS